MEKKIKYDEVSPLVVTVHVLTVVVLLYRRFSGGGPAACESSRLEYRAKRRRRRPKGWRRPRTRPSSTGEMHSIADSA